MLLQWPIGAQTWRSSVSRLCAIFLSTRCGSWLYIIYSHRFREGSSRGRLQCAGSAVIRTLLEHIDDKWSCSKIFVVFRGKGAGDELK